MFLEQCIDNNKGQKLECKELMSTGWTIQYKYSIRETYMLQYLVAPMTCYKCSGWIMPKMEKRIARKTEF